MYLLFVYGLFEAAASLCCILLLLCVFGIEYQTSIFAVYIQCIVCIHLHLTFMHLADAFIQSDLSCISRYTFYILISSCFSSESNPWPWRCKH